MPPTQDTPTPDTSSAGLMAAIMVAKHFMREDGLLSFMLRFRGQVVIIAPDSNAQLLRRDYDLTVAGLREGPIGPHPDEQLPQELLQPAPVGAGRIGLPPEQQRHGVAADAETPEEALRLKRIARMVRTMAAASLATSAAAYLEPCSQQLPQH